MATVRSRMSMMRIVTARESATRKVRHRSPPRPQSMEIALSTELVFGRKIVDRRALPGGRRAPQHDLARDVCAAACGMWNGEPQFVPSESEGPLQIGSFPVREC